ncbi:MAG TPA: LCP family protein [Acidimicrobiia bacterium]|nr:LCP family protein [Acidimicrobiia bacterium]
MTFRRTTALLIAFVLLLAACSQAEVVPTTVPTTTTSTSSTTTTTVPPTTTTTIPPLDIEGSTDLLTRVIDGFYAYASGASTEAPAVPEPVLAAITPREVETPRQGTAAVGVFKDAQVAAVEMGPDIFLLVADGGPWRIVGGEWPSLEVPAYFGSGPRHIAVVGSDARPGQNVAATRNDSIHFVGLDGAGGGAVVGLPRDSYIPIPGVGRRKVTSALSLGGPATMMATFTQLTGLEFEGYLLTGFSGFQALVGDVLGGVLVDVPFAINDRWAHVALSAGEQVLNGAQALGFSRARKTVPRGDFTRSEHQGKVIIGAAKTVQAMGYMALPTLIEKSAPHLITDLTPEELLTFSAMAISADLGSVSNVVASGSTGSAGGASVVFLSSSVDELFADLADGRLGN